MHSLTRYYVIHKVKLLDVYFRPRPPKETTTTRENQDTANRSRPTHNNSDRQRLPVYWYTGIIETPSLMSHSFISPPIHPTAHYHHITTAREQLLRHDRQRVVLSLRGGNRPGGLLGPPSGRGAGGGAAVEASAAGEAAVALAVRPPIDEGGNATDEPEQGGSEVDPDGVLHAAHAGVPLGVLVDVHAAEQAEQRDPQREQHEAPGRHQREPQDEGYQVQHRRHRRQDTDHHCVDLCRGAHERISSEQPAPFFFPDR